MISKPNLCKMKQGWEILPFEDCIVKVKYTTKIPNNDYLKQGLYPIISQEDGLVSGYWNNVVDVFKIVTPVVIFGDHTRILKYVDFDFVLGADGVKILQPIKRINAKFFKLYLESCKIPSLGYSRHYKLLKELQVPVPPVAEQKRIVAELDCLSGVIEKKKQQLKELDTLAQSIFYEMFGDPITNEKGWEYSHLRDICDKITDGTHDTPERLNSGVKFITGKHITAGVIDYENSDYVLKEIHDEIYARCNPEFGDVLYTNIGINLGTAAINIVYYEFSMKNVALLKVNKNIINGYYLQSYLNDRDVRNDIINDFSNGGAQKFLSLKMIAKIPVPLPPLSLQQAFASKIEAIEKQKELIKQSIKEVETLFNSRMDYYFN